MTATKPRSMRWLAALAGAILIPASLFAQAAPARLTVAEAVAAAQRNNLGVRSAAIESRIKKRASDFSFNKFLPSVSVSGTFLELNRVSPSLVGFASGSGIYFTPDKANIALGLTVQEVFSPVFLALMDQAALDYQRSLISKAQAERNIEAAVKKFFYQILVQDEAIELTRARLDSAKERFRQAEISYKLGQASELNYSYARMNVESLIPDLRSMETARAAALTMFQELLGFEPNPDMKLEGRLDADTIAVGELKVDEGTRFDVRLAQQGVKQLETTLKAQSLAFMPNLILGFKMDPAINGPDSSNIWDTKNWNQSSGALSLTLSWSLDPLLPGSSIRVAKGEVEDRLALAREASVQTLRAARDDAVNQARAIKDSVEKIVNLTNVAEASKRAFELTSAAYQLGAGRYLDMQDAEVALQGTQIQLLNERLKLASLIYDFEAKYEGLNLDGAAAKN